ncbi:hypothetical protein ACJX0J_010311, partial [Zea mays]
AHVGNWIITYILESERNKVKDCERYTACFLNFRGLYVCMSVGTRTWHMGVTFLTVINQSFYYSCCVVAIVEVIHNFVSSEKKKTAGYSSPLMKISRAKPKSRLHTAWISICEIGSMIGAVEESILRASFHGKLEDLSDEKVDFDPNEDDL